MGDDKRRTPPQGRAYPRQQSQTERDVEGFAARREREASVPSFTDRDITGQYQGPELAEARSTRHPLDRINRLEEKHDDLVKVVGGMKDSLSTMGSCVENMSG